MEDPILSETQKYTMYTAALHLSRSSLLSAAGLPVADVGVKAYDGDSKTQGITECVVAIGFGIMHGHQSTITEVLTLVSKQLDLHVAVVGHWEGHNFNGKGNHGVHNRQQIQYHLFCASANDDC